MRRNGTAAQFRGAIGCKLERYGRAGEIRIMVWGQHWRVFYEPSTSAFMRVCDLPQGRLLIELESAPDASLDPLTGFWTWLEEELNALGFAEVGKVAAADEQAPERPDWWPTTEETQAKWRKLWECYQSLRQDFRGRWEDIATDDPEPSYEDWIDRNKDELGWSLKKRRLRDVRKAGENGWLD